MKSDYLKYCTVGNGTDLLPNVMLDVALFYVLRNIKSMTKVWDQDQPFNYSEYTQPVVEQINLEILNS